MYNIHKHVSIYMYTIWRQVYNFGPFCSGGVMIKLELHFCMKNVTECSSIYLLTWHTLQSANVEVIFGVTGRWTSCPTLLVHLPLGALLFR